MMVAPDQISHLRRLWKAGVSAVECGQEIGLTGAPEDIREAVLHAIESGARGATKGTAKIRAAVDKRRTAAPPESEDEDTGMEFDGATGDLETDKDIPLDQRKQLIQLTASTCRWPVGNPKEPSTFFFCGGEAVEDENYCRRHCWIAYPATGHRRKLKTRL